MYNLKHVLFEERVEFRTEIMLESQFFETCKMQKKAIRFGKNKGI